MNRYRPPALTDGLKPHLDRLGKDYDAFIAAYLDMKRLGVVNKIRLAELFGVDRKAIGRWIEQYEREAGSDAGV